MDYFIRISYPYDTIQEWVTKVTQHSKALVCYQHDVTDNIHIHLYATQVTVSTDSLKGWLNKMLGKKVKSTEWSFKNKGINPDCIAYMSKGKLDPVFTHGFEDDYIKSKKDQGYDVTDRVVAVKRKNITQYEIACNIFEKLPKNGFLNGKPDETVPEVYRRLTELAIEQHNELRKAYNEFSIRTCIQTAYNMHTKCRKQFVDKMVDKFFS